MYVIKLLFLFLFLGLHLSFAQINIKDSSITFPLLTISYSYQFPEADLVKRYAANSNTGSSFMLKTKKNMLWGVTGNFLFGNSVKEPVLQNLTTQKGYILNTAGEYADILLFERGFLLSFQVGKIFSAEKPNPNSGFVCIGGIGVLQHKIRFEGTDKVPFLKNDYKKGYDRLTNGIAITEFIGYFFFGNKRLINFYGGIEFMQAKTKSRRFDFDLMKQDNSSRIDLLWGPKVGWIIPFYKKVPQDYYYY